MNYSEIDPKNLIAESYQIEGITSSECRSIFLDWALSIPLEKDSTLLISKLLIYYQDESEDHPMTLLLSSSLELKGENRRTGRRRSRIH
ncbi:MAG: hypothetical protein ACKVKC_07420 [Rhodobacterales bacterium]|jgi:hypothetical protein|tara:strand:+ start:24 stop:290 length:267 start_codon:yes stop_codon:yes gene_type:complete